MLTSANGVNNLLTWLSQEFRAGPVGAFTSKIPQLGDEVERRHFGQLKCNKGQNYCWAIKRGPICNVRGAMHTELDVVNANKQIITSDFECKLRSDPFT